MLKKLYIADIFGTHFQFYNFGDRKYHTPLGFLLSIACYSLVAAFIGVFGTDLFKRINPKIVFEDVRPLKHKIRKLVPETFTLAWRIQDENGDTVDITNKLWIDVKYERYNRNNETNAMENSGFKFPQISCTDPSLTLDKEFVRGRKLADWSCIDYENQNTTVGGYWEADFVYYFSIWVYFCPNNNREDPKCKTLDGLKELLVQRSKLYFTFMYPEFYFEPGNLDNPLRRSYVEYFAIINVNLFKRERIYFKPISAEDDQNLLLTEFKSFNLTAHRGWQNEVGVKFDSDIENKKLSSDLYSFLIYFDKGGDRYIRTFMKLQDLAATVGGFMQLIFVIGKILSAQFNSYQRNISLINSVFDFNKDFKEDSPLEPKLSQSSGPLIIKKGNNANVVDEKSDQLKLQENKSKKTVTISSQKLVITAANLRKGANLDLLAEQDFLDNNNSIKVDESNVIEMETKKTSTGTKDKNSHPALNPSFSKYTMTTQKKDLMGYNTMKTRKDNLPDYSQKKTTELLRKLKNEEKSIEDGKTEFGLGFRLFVKKFLCRGLLTNDERELVNIYEFALDYLKEKLDISEYVTMVMNLDKIILFNFNEVQKASFKNMKKPNLFNREECNLFELELDKRDPEKIAEKQKEIEDEDMKILKYFSKKLRDNNFDISDEKLWDFLDPKYKRVIISNIDEVE